MGVLSDPNMALQRESAGPVTEITVEDTWRRMPGETIAVTARMVHRGARAVGRVVDTMPSGVRGEAIGRYRAETLGADGRYYKIATYSRYAAAVKAVMEF